ncbi:unnamed protein product [Porites lobata]|uniref:Uncharacterized protein n=1 Tax=Porites lobata TaxID=104759 RepID=A0ABN8MVQ0_9CNID|nr:unnamed protein product [Porites lobata]
MALRNHNNAGNLPTTHRICEEDITIIVLEQNQYRTQQTMAFEPGMSTPWEQYRADGQPRAVAVCCVVALYSRQSKEIWICDITSSNANELVVNDGQYKMIVTVYPRRNAVVSNFATDGGGNRLPSYARMFAFLLPLDIPMIYNATVQLTKEDGAILCHEIVLTIRINLLEASVSWLQQSENLFEVEYPLPKIKLTGVLRFNFGWNVIMHFENLADNGEFEVYRRHRLILENWAKTRPHYQDLVAMILLEEGVACLIQHRLEEGVSLARRACRLSSHFSCVNDRAIRGYASAVYAAAERFAGNQDGAKEHLVDALEIFEPMEPSTYTSITLYNIGAITMEKSATIGITATEEKEAENFLQKAADHWMYQQLNTTIRVLPRVYNRLISLYLKSSPNTAPDLNVTVSQESLTRASDVIGRFENLFPDCSKWMKTTFCLGKTDYCIRKRDIDGGLGVAQQALEISLASGLQRETTGARRRIDLLRELDNHRRHPPEVPATL